MIADGFDITPTMRIPDGDESTILSYLDKGIRLITVPNLKTKEEAEALVQYTYYAPIGVRSSTSIRSILALKEGGRRELYNEINANTILVPQLEHINALENVEELIGVDGVDYFTPVSRTRRSRWVWPVRLTATPCMMPGTRARTR